MRDERRMNGIGQKIQTHVSDMSTKAQWSYNTCVCDLICA